ncbi:DUF4386 family protein [Dactylosporangium sp. NPDC005572]|uniref:DUF4386 family protein n=1 Tax=Dactylosporangium sp. NPDC005572 TaxID=3156889 RepID=UPI0033A55880
MIGYLLIGAAVVANVAFTGLGSVFGYPDVLQDPPAEVLARFHADAWVIGGLFLLLALGAGLLAPVAIGLGTSRAAVRVGVAAAAVQVAGLLRWPLIVPFVDDPETFRTLNLVLGQLIGESAGYALTAAWTVLVALGLHRAGRLDRWSAGAGIVTAAMIATGLLVPFDVPGADLANFVGYVGWSLWLVALGIRLIVRRRQIPPVTRTVVPVA